MADEHATTARGRVSWHGGFLEDNVAHDVTERLVMRDVLSHRNSEPTVEEDMSAAESDNGRGTAGQEYRDL
jgi:hypothetical protein